LSLEDKSHHHHGRHANRPDLTGEHKYGDTGQLVIAIIFLTIWIPDSFILKYSTFLNNNIKWYNTVIPGFIILILAGYLAWEGHKKIFDEIREPPRVITNGVFSIVRHPLYLASILTYLGLIILTLSLLSFIIWIIAIIFYYYISRHEEKLLLSRFGKEYEDYMKKVPMFFPKPWSS
jgi:protein-S-isoprenylcysteine O-methyltransferase Ste14